MKEQTYIRWPKPALKNQEERLMDPDTYQTAEWRNTSPAGDMICIGFNVGANITTKVKIDMDNARLFATSLRRLIDNYDQSPMETAAASTGF